MNKITIQKYFTGQRRLIAAMVSVLIVYLIVQSFGAKLGISDGIDKNIIYIMGLTAIVSAFTTNYIYKKFHVKYGGPNIKW